MFIILLSLSIYKYNLQDNIEIINYIIIMMIVGIIIIYKVYTNPIHILYAVSSILTYFIRTPEFLDKDVYFPKYKLFEDPTNFIKLKEEVNNMLQLTNNGNELGLTRDSYSGANYDIGIDVKEDTNKVRAWRILNIKAGDTYSKDAIDHFPFLVKLLDGMPEIVSCVISILEEGVKIPIHTGYYKGIMRFMVPIIVPKDKDNVFLCVNRIKYHWKEGETVLWDDNYPHKVYNNTNEIRIVIYMDVKRPFTGFVQIFNDTIIKLISNSDMIKKEIKKTEIQVKI
jgi:beta-hydroxylase